jgi:hypothetical protein
MLDQTFTSNAIQKLIPIIRSKTPAQLFSFRLHTYSLPKGSPSLKRTSSERRAGTAWEPSKPEIKKKVSFPLKRSVSLPPPLSFLCLPLSMLKPWRQEEARRHKKNTGNIEMKDKLINKHKKFWEELIAYFPLIRHGPHRKRTRCLAVIRELLPSRWVATIGVIHRHTHTESNVIS